MLTDFPLTLFSTLDAQDILLLCLGALFSGLVKGFSGFGTAMVFLPFGGQVLEPEAAIIAMAAMDILGPIPVVPRAIRDATLDQVGRLIGASLIAIPLGVLVLSFISADAFRYTVSFTSLCLLGILLLGLRLSSTPSLRLQYGTGFGAGFLGGAAGLPGPPVILLYMASPLKPAQIRANTILYLLSADIIIFAVFALSGKNIIPPMLIGVMLVIPYMVAIKLGSWVFNPDNARVYRIVGYAIIAASALRGLPIWGHLL